MKKYSLPGKHVRFVIKASKLRPLPGGYSKYQIRWITLCLVMLAGFAGLGVHSVLRSHAASASVALEAENGTLSGAAGRVTDSGASGGSAVRFGSGTVTPPPPSKSPPPPPLVNPPPPTATTEKFGMSAPANLWAQRLAEVGGPAHIKYRRIYESSFGASLTLEKEAQAAGMIPVVSFKTGNYTWAQVAGGAADSDLRALVTRLNAIPGPKYIAVHHEPNGDGTAKDWSAMNIHALPILKTANNVQVGVIANGWWWSSQSQGLSDAEIAAWIPSSLKSVCNFIAADTYQDAGLNEDGSVKMANMASWARRTGGVSALGVGEFNGFTAAAITNVMNEAKRESLFRWALVWNSDTSGTLGTPLSGARLDAFKAGLATPNPT